ncbi:hypothetical protein Egran_00707, partial [Elaphomyces granulatus]
SVASVLEEIPEDLPPVYGEPPAWAETRPELCDAIPWFRSLQGGIYYNAGLCWGVLIDADTGLRAYMDDEIVITRIGGCSMKDGQGNLVQTKDHDESTKGLAALLNSKNTQTPVGMVIGNRSTLVGRKLPYKYNILAYFRISDLWYEKVNGKACARIRYQKVDLAEKSWWAAKDSPDPLPLRQRDFQTRPETPKCSRCSKPSPRIYNEGWMCLQPECKRFWMIGKSASPKDLTYHPTFLNFRLPPDESILPHFSLVPDLLSTLPEATSDYTFSRITWKGIVCPLCRKCVSRKFWDGWRCTDPISYSNCVASCKFEKRLNTHPVSLRSVVHDLELGAIKRASVPSSTCLQPVVEFSRTYLKHTYHIEGVGSVTHFLASRDVLGRPNGPNDLFEQLQTTDLGLRRYPLQQSVVAGTLTAHFAVNYGMPYKYVVAVDSKGFDEAPPVIMNALSRLTWATRQVVASAEGAALLPNELLLLGYFEEMAIGYHDDGESSLGPTIATLSLGGKASMKVRLKDQYFRGRSKSNKLVTNDPVLVSCGKYEQRKALKDELDNGSITAEEYDQRRTEICRAITRREASPIINMEIQHGDFVVMHGADLQKYFEHAVSPDDKLRFALTARYVKPEEVQSKEHHKGVFSLTPDMEYNGE